MYSQYWTTGIGGIFINLPGEPILRGESGFYSCAVSLFAIFEFDDSYALYCIYKSVSISCRKALKTSLKNDIISYYIMTGVRYAQENIIWC